MATAYQNLSSYDPNQVPDASDMRVAIVAAEWNALITNALLKGACDTLERHGVCAKNILVARVPGTVELTFAARAMAASYEPDAVIAIGCVVRGDTPHFDYVCQSVTSGITQLNLTFAKIPFIFGVLTTDTMQQAVFVMFFFVMILILMSGLFTPVSSMPDWAQAITIFNPLKYFIQVMRLVYLKGSAFAEMTTQFFVLCGFAVFFNTWAVLSYKKSR